MEECPKRKPRRRNAPRRRKKRPPAQRVLSFGRGGWRPGAGRPVEKRKDKIVLHRKRARFTKNTPCHITLRVRREIANLRSGKRIRLVRRALQKGCQKRGFRIVDWSVQGNHMHLIVEADSAKALGRGMQGFTIRVAKGLNRLAKRKGPVFTERYHVHHLETPSEVQRARAYVIKNFKRHARERGERLPQNFVDAHSSWAWFDGWRDIPAYLARRAEKERAGPRLVAKAKGWLLRTGWRRRGLVTLNATPG